MLEAGHKLAVGSESMIGWCIANAQARIALDVGEEAVRFVNPWLPETRSEMALPLISRGQVIGAVTIQSTQAAAFSQEDIAVLQAMANQLANSIENARLYTETKQRTQEISAALEVTTAVSSTLDLEEVLAVIAEQMSKAIGVDGCTISQWDKASDTIVTWIEMRLDDSETDEPGSAYALNDFPATKNVLESGQPFALSVGDPDVDPAEIALMRTYGHLSLLMLPLAIGDRTIGLIELAEDKHERQFTAAEIRLCQALADQAAIAIENARLFEETQERLRELTMLSDVSQALAGASLRAEEIAEIVTHQFVEVMGIPEASVSLLDPEAGTMRVLVDVYVGEESAPSEGAQDVFRLADYPATHRVMETMQPLVVQASDPEADPAELAYMQEYGTVTLVIIPLAVKGQPIGVIELEAWDQERHYTPEQLNLATTMANQAAVALENARLFEQTQAALSEVEATHRAYLQREWQDYLHQGETLRRNGFLYDQSLASAVGPAQVTVEPDLWRPEMERALTEGHPATTEKNGDSEERSGLAAPIVLRGQTIGVLGLEDPQGNHQWSEEDQAMAEAVGRQLALALENARLLEETQRRVARERLTGEVTGRMRESLDLDTVLRTAVREIGRALELHDLTIRLEMETDGAH